MFGCVVRDTMPKHGLSNCYGGLRDVALFVLGCGVASKGAVTAKWSMIDLVTEFIKMLVQSETLYVRISTLYFLVVGTHARQ